MPFPCGWYFTDRAFLFEAKVKKTAENQNPPDPLAKGESRHPSFEHLLIERVECFAILVGLPKMAKV